MSMDASLRQVAAYLVLMFVLAAPVTAYSADPIFERPAERDAAFEDCANVCQATIDRRIAQCPGYREIQSPGDKSTSPPQCKKAAIDDFASCMAMCPAPRFQPQG